MPKPSAPSDAPPRGKLGELLRSLGLLSESEVRNALQRQRDDGGRLGTCLLDVGLVDEPMLLAALGAQQRSTTCDAAALDALPEAVARLLPARSAIQVGAVPIASTGRWIEVAMMDPSDLGLVYELESVVGLRVLPRLALEVRVRESLERLYGATVTERLARTRERILRRRALGAARAPASVGALR